MRKCFYGHVDGDAIMRNKCVFPWFAAVGCGVGACVVTPSNCCVLFREHVRIVQMACCFWFEQINGGGCFGNKVWLVFGMICTGLVEDLKLTLGRFEPSLCLAIENDGEDTFWF